MDKNISLFHDIGPYFHQRNSKLILNLCQVDGRSTIDFDLIFVGENGPYTVSYVMNIIYWFLYLRFQSNYWLNQKLIIEAIGIIEINEVGNNDRVIVV